MVKWKSKKDKQATRGPFTEEAGRWDLPQAPRRLFPHAAGSARLLTSAPNVGYTIKMKFVYLFTRQPLPANANDHSNHTEVEEK